MKEALAWSVFYVALPLAVRPLRVDRPRRRPRRGVLHRLPRREDAERRQPLRLHAAARGLRGARGAQAAGAALRHRRRARSCAASSSRSAPPPCPASTGCSWSSARSCWSPASSCCATRSAGTSTRSTCRDARGQGGAPRHAGQRGVRRRAAHRGPEGRARADAVRAGDHRGAGHRHRLRRRLRARRLRHHRRPLPGLRHQRLRAARPARALLRARGRAQRRWSTSATASQRSSASSAPSWCCTGRTWCGRRCPTCRRWPRCS